MQELLEWLFANKDKARNPLVNCFKSVETALGQVLLLFVFFSHENDVTKTLLREERQQKQPFVSCHVVV